MTEETATGRVIRLIQEDAREQCAKMIESYTPDQIRMAAGEMTAQEMRAVRAVQRWWAAAIRVANGKTAP